MKVSEVAGDVDVGAELVEVGVHGVVGDIDGGGVVLVGVGWVGIGQVPPR